MKVRTFLLGAAICAFIVGCGGGKPTVADSPDQAILQAKDGLADNKPQVIFTMLPPSYQEDINSLVADAATRMDAEVWNKGVGILKKTTGILKTKRDLILSADMMQAVPNPDDVKQNWQHAVTVLETLVKSDFANLNRLRKGDVGGLLAGSGATVMKQFTELVSASEQAQKLNANLDKLRSVTATVVSQDGDAAVVKVTSKGEDPEDVEMVRVEGRWIPKEMATEFKEGIAEMREGLSKLDFTSDEGKQKKAMLMVQMGAVEAMLDQLAAAETKEAIEGVIGGMMMGLMGGM